MKALFKHTLRSAADSKAQVFIIILTVAVVTAMIFASFSISDVFYNLNMAENDRVAQGADMLLGSNGSASEFFSRARTESVLAKNPGDIARAEFFLKFTTVMRFADSTKTVLLEATDLNDYFSIHNLEYVDYSENTANVMPIIVGKTFAETSGIKAGDTVEIYMAAYDSYVEMFVEYVAADEGIFKSAFNNNVLVDFSSAGNFGMVSAVYITFNNPTLYAKYLAEFDEVLPAIACREGNNYSEVRDIVFNNTLLFGIGLMFIVATMGLILLTSYMIVARKRTREMVVFKAAGASPALTALIMLLEVAVYAVVGAALGAALGRMVMQLLVNSMLPYASDAVTYQIWKYVVAIITAIGVTIIASLAPVIAVSKKTISELNSDSPRQARKPKPLLFAILTVVAAGMLAATWFLQGIWVALLCLADIVVVVLWIAYAVPLALKAFTWLLYKIKKGGGFGLGTLTPNRNKAMRTITTLVTVIIAFSFIVFEIVSLIKFAVTPFSSRYTADAVITVSTKISDEDRFGLLQSLYVEGVDDAGYMNSADFVLPKGRVELSDTEKYFSLYGVDGLWMLEHCVDTLDDDTKERWQASSNPLVLSEDMLIRLGYSIGDTVQYSPGSEDYKNRVFEFTIVGVDRTITRYDRVGYVRYDVLKDISEGITCFADFMEVGDADAIMLDLIRAVDALNIGRSFVLTFNEWSAAESGGIEGLIGILSFIQYAIIAVGLIGIINVSIVTTYDRAPELLLYRLSGLSPEGYLQLSASEGLSMALAGATTGFAVCTVLNTLLPVLVGIVDKYLHFGVVSALSAYITVAGSLVFAGCWMLIALVHRRSKMASYNERFMT